MVVDGSGFFVFPTHIFECLDSFGVILSPCHRCILDLCIWGNLPLGFRTVAARTTWQCKSHLHSRSGPDVCRCLRSIHNSLLRFSVRILLLESLEDRAILLLHGLLSLDVTRAALQFSHSEPLWRDPFLRTQYGMDRVSNFSFVHRFVFSVGAKQVPQVQYTMPSAQYFEQWEHWVLEEISHNSNHSTFSRMWTNIFDSSLRGLHVQFFCNSSISAPLFGCCWLHELTFWLLVFRSFSCSTMWNTLDSTVNSVFPSSATGLPVLVLRWWESSRWTCQGSFRIILGGGRGDKGKFLIQNFFSFWIYTLSTVGWQRVIKDNDIGSTTLPEF